MLLKKLAVAILQTVLLISLPHFLSAQPSQLSHETSLAQLSGELENIAQEVSPAIVQIIASGYASGGNGQTSLLSKQRSTGSGVILDPNGYIVTNAHVIRGSRRTQVVLTPAAEKNGEHRSILKPRGRVVGAQIVGVDLETDLAVLRVMETNLPFMSLGDSDDIRKGQIVLAFGSPLGLENSVTMGVVSSVARQLRPEDPMIYIQTDAPINPGNSGGPLVSTTGKIVGINTLIFSQSGGSEGVGFAAPSNIVKNVYENIKATGHVHRGEIGAEVQTITPLMASALDLPNVGHIIVANVIPHGPADKAGLRTGDIILTLDNRAVENGRQFEVNLYRRGIGDAVLVEIQRGVVNKTLRVPIRERPDDPDRFSELVTPERNLLPKLGLLGLDLNETVLHMLPPLRIKSGVVVANQANLAYEGDGFRPGDVIHAVNNEAVTSVQDLRNILANLDSYAPVVAQIERFREMKYISLELE